jgi:flavin reductase ActVB
VAIEKQAFFDVMASFPTGVAIVTTMDREGTPRGLTTTALCSVSAHPPTLLVSVARASRTLAALRDTRRFVVNFVGNGRNELVMRFASKAEDKFAEVSWRPTASGIPLLRDDVLAWAECTVEREVDVGDHVLFVAEVVDGGVEDDVEPLMYYRRSWGVWTPAQETSDPDAVQMPSVEVSGRDVRWHGAEI